MNARDRLAALNAAREKQRAAPKLRATVASDAKTKRARTLKAVRPNAGIEAHYRGKLLDLIREMNASVEYWVRSAYRANEPEVTALDEAPASIMRKAVAKLARRWQQRFNAMAPQLARHFAISIQDRSDRALAKIFKDAGFTVRFKLSPAQNDVLQATVNQNVALIKSIPQKYFTQVEGMVQRSVQAGRDMGQLADDLQRQFGVAKRRAHLIARDQNNKATNAMVHVRQRELGINRAVWRHSHAGKEPRPTHVQMDGKTYDTAQGMWDSDEGEYVLPGQLINCRCTSRPVLPWQ